MPRIRQSYRAILLALVVAVVVIGGAVALGLWNRTRSDSNNPIRQWFTDPASRPTLTTRMDRTPCPGAPFSLPSDGLIGLLWDDPAAPYTLFNPHTGIDIFGDGTPGEVPVYAVYDGWLTRLPEWLSTVIIRHDDPLQPGRTIWTYYTHMASRDGSESYVSQAFPPGTTDQPVQRGELLGYQGEFAGAGRAPIGLHVHMSIVRSAPDGGFTNEAVLANTLDPSPYFGMPLNLLDRPARPITCRL